MEPTEPPDSPLASTPDQGTWKDALAWLPDPMIAFDRAGRILYANHACEDFLGFDRAELVGQGIKGLLPDRCVTQFDALVAERLLREPTESAGDVLELSIAKIDGTMLPAKLRLARIAAPGEQANILCCCLQRAGSCVDPLGREAAVMRALKKIEEHSSLLAHEIKNPIAAVNMALRAVADRLGEDEHEVLSDLVDRMKRVEDLIRHTTAFAKPLELTKTEFRLSRLVQCADEALGEDTAGFRPLEVASSGEESIIVGDFARLRGVLSELLCNARDSTGPQGRVRLEACADETGVRMRVEDDGDGIPERIRSALFEPFVTSKADGSGLGLAIARKVVEAHGGTLECQSGTLGGACFEISLPRPT